MVLRFLLLLLRLGQNGLGRIGRLALGGSLRGGLLTFLLEPNEVLGRFLGRLVRGGGGGHLVLGVSQGLVGRLLLRLRFGQLLRGGRRQSLRMLLVLPCLGQGGLGVIGRFAFGRGLVRGLLLFRLRLGGIRANLFGPGLGLLGRRLGCLTLGGGLGHLVLDARQNLVCEFLVSRCFGQHSRNGGRPILGLLLALPCLGQGSRGINSRFAFGGAWAAACFFSSADFATS